MDLFIFYSLCVASLSLWLPNKNKLISLSICFLVLILSAINHNIFPTGIILFIAFFLFCYLYSKITNLFFRIPVGVALSFIIFIVTSTYLPWFKNIIILDKVRFSEISTPFTMQVNLAKDLCGLMMASLLFTWNQKWQDWKYSLQGIFIPICILTIILMAPALATHFIKFNFKIPSESLLYILDNLLLVSVVEEVFFRGFIQQNLKKLFIHIKCNSQISSIFAILISAIYFGFAHYHSGIIMIILAAVAGIGYGYVFKKTNRLESAILTHFTVNFIHFIFFTYPALAK